MKSVKSYNNAQKKDTRVVTLYAEVMNNRDFKCMHIQYADTDDWMILSMQDDDVVNVVSNLDDDRNLTFASNIDALQWFRNEVFNNPAFREAWVRDLN